jgi:hypothetical protein
MVGFLSSDFMHMPCLWPLLRAVAAVHPEPPSKKAQHLEPCGMDFRPVLRANSFSIEAGPALNLVFGASCFHWHCGLRSTAPSVVVLRSLWSLWSGSDVQALWIARWAAFQTLEFCVLRAGGTQALTRPGTGFFQLNCEQSFETS